jgi:hypothetical protein
MAIEKLAPNGTVIEFPDGTPDEDIQKYLSLPEYQAKEQQEDNSERSLLSDIPTQVVGGVRDAVQSTIGFVEGLGDTLGEKTNIGGLVFGEKADNGIVGYKSYDELVRDGDSNPLFGKFGTKDAIQLPEIDQADTVVGGLTRGVTQFATGWITGGKLLRGASNQLSTSTAIKLAKGAKANPITASLGKGAVADTIAFDEETGRFSDIINEYTPALANPLTDYLASDPDDTFWEGRFKNTLEGLALGGITEGLFRTARYIKNKKQQINNEKFDQKILEEDETILKYQQDYPPTNKGDNARLDDLTKTPSGDGFFPDDIYSKNGIRFYGVADETIDKESFDAINKARNNPDLEITVYRGVPKGINSINEGDWVTLSKTYAENHASGGYGRNGDEAGIVISKKVKVKDIYSTGNDVNEFGYSPDKSADKARKANLLENKPKVNTKVKTEDLQAEIDDAVFNNFKKLQTKKVKGKNVQRTNEDFDQKLSLDEGLDLGISTARWKVLNGEGLFTLENIAKANQKALAKLNTVRSDEIVQRLADRKYRGNIAKVYDEFGTLADNLDEVDSLIVAHEMMLQSTLNIIPKLAREVKIKGSGTTVADVKFALGLAEGGWINDIRVAKGLGRGLRQRGVVKQEVESLTKNTENNIKNTVNEWRTFGGKVEDFIEQLARADDANATQKVIAWATKNKTWNIANEVWINALLSNPKTHIVNMTSNFVNTFLKPLEAGVGSLIRLENAQKYAKIRAEGANAISTLAGLTKYLDDVVHYTRLSFKRSDGIIAGSGASKLDNPTQNLKGKVGTFVNTPTRFLNTEDEFFKQINYRARMYSIAVQKATADGVSKTKKVGNSLKTKKPITEFEAKVEQYFREGFDETNTIGINPDALKYAQEATFTQELFGVFDKIQNIANNYPYIRQIIPFVKTPINLMMAIVDRTPLGFARKQFRDDFFGRSGNLYRTAQVRGQIATGFALITYANYLASTGQITGSTSLPSDAPIQSKGLKDLNRNLGFQPYSLRTFNEETGKYEYYAFGRLDPFGAFLGLVADFHTFNNKLTQDELARVGNSMLLTLYRQGEDVSGQLGTGTQLANYAKAGWSAFTRNVFSKTYLKGLTESLQVLTSDDPDRYGRLINSKFGSFYPNIFSKLVNDPYYRDARTLLDEAKKRTGLGYVQKKYDFRGNAYKVEGSDEQRLFNGVFNPFTYSEQKIDPVAEEIIRLGVNVPNVSQYYNGAIDLTLFQNKKGTNAYDRLNEILNEVTIGNKTLDQQLNDLINSDLYKNNLSDPIIVDENVKNNGGKVREIRKLITRYHKLAEVELLNEMDNFFSTKDKTGKFSLRTANLKAVSNKTKIGLGININNKDIDELYRFSQ